MVWAETRDSGSITHPPEVRPGAETGVLSLPVRAPHLLQHFSQCLSQRGGG